MGIFKLRRLIPVRYPDGQLDKLPSQVLNRMIESHEIVEFKRKDGWVLIGSDKLRGRVPGYYHGKERRWH